MDKKLLMQKAYNWIAEQDENAAIISDGDIDIASEFIAEFIQNLIDNGVLAEPSDENAVLPIHSVSNSAFIAEDPETEEQIIVNAYTIEDAIKTLEANGYPETTEIRYKPLKALHCC